MQTVSALDSDLIIKADNEYLKNVRIEGRFKPILVFDYNAKIVDTFLKKEYAMVTRIKLSWIEACRVKMILALKSFGMGWLLKVGTRFSRPGLDSGQDQAEKRRTVYQGDRVETERKHDQRPGSMKKNKEGFPRG